MTVNLLSNLIDLLLQRELASGGFPEQLGDEYRPDATAWSIIALAANDIDSQIINSGRQRLAKEQKKDGRLSITADHSEAFWPTTLAALAWHGDPVYKEMQSRAIDFLIHASGTHWPRQAGSPVSHDTSIPGWPWVNATHSWVEPTALALLALSISGNENLPRSRQAAMLLLDRQLPGGGWNYGNTRVFGQELRPMPASTGVALQALAGRAAPTEVEQSLSYLESIIDHTRTPFSLAWGLLGLSAWGRRPRHAQELIAASLDRQERLGGYPTTHLGLLLLAATAENGLLEVLTDLQGRYRG